ncbi:MAG TPA: uroporphyrinogen-III C-methyltransferase [Verrucomicrobiae bacterium]|nr:uroporphyrinogen-III C-methyltransferase [Verrucomicrobiae bacterium]
MATGICYLIGAGPGDPRLLTIRAQQILSCADVVVYDYLCNPRLLRWTRPDAEKVLAGKRSRNPELTQEATNAILIDRTRRGLVVARLKGGDPCVFGRGGEEAEQLAKAGLRFEIVPGITSAIAVPAYAGIPVTHRDHCSEFIVATGHIDPHKHAVNLDYPLLARFQGTRIILMGVGKLREITANLIAAGSAPDTPAAVVQWGTLRRQRSVRGTLADLATAAERERIGPPGVIVVGGVASMGDELRWFDRGPLFGQRVVVTRPTTEAEPLALALEDLGADIIEVPLIRIAPPADPAALEASARRAGEFDWIAFASANAARAFFGALFRVGTDIRGLAGTRFAVVGEETASVLRSLHLLPDLVPSKFTGDALAAVFRDMDMGGKRVLLPRGNLGREALEQSLRKQGAVVEVVEAYRTEAETGDPFGGRARLAEEGADWVTFASPSAAEQWFAQRIACPGSWKAASIGPATSARLRALGREPGAEADPHTADGLVAAILAASQI